MGGRPVSGLSAELKNPHLKRAVFLRNVTQCRGFGWIFWNDVNKGKNGHEIWYTECED
jgi:hypothetical protein